MVVYSNLEVFVVGTMTLTANDTGRAVFFDGACLPDKTGHFGRFGGRFVPETIMPALEQLEKAYLEAKNDPAFNTELEYYLREYVGRPSTLYSAERLTKKLGAQKYI